MNLPRIMTAEERSDLRSGAHLIYRQLKSAAKRHAGNVAEGTRKRSLLARNKIASGLVHAGLWIGSGSKGGDEGCTG